MSKQYGSQRKDASLESRTQAAKDAKFLTTPHLYSESTFLKRFSGWLVGRSTGGVRHHRFGTLSTGSKFHCTPCTKEKSTILVTNTIKLQWYHGHCQEDRSG